MRVISGTAKGQRLFAPKGFKTRPTADRVKESLFNIIAGAIEGAEVLDLYAGAGSLAVEALSRGAKAVVLVESDKGAAAAINRNLVATGFTDRTIVMQAPVNRALDQLIARRQVFDLIFLDPPYKINQAELEIVLEKTAGCLSKFGLAILEHRPDLPELEPGGGLFLSGGRRYGDTALSFYKKRD
ncbi:MAG: 16S rRNA (guanine(966)-N(2))-methyltransferase RsmD [Actinomycetota bacterium]|nr:16S rRNA (guanine(966)-N(2))-methyltransferase RsmD [Actinomycetota bacterium]